MFKKYTVLTLGLLLAGQPAFGARTPFSKVPKKMVVNAARGLGVSFATGFTLGGALGFGLSTQSYNNIFDDNKTAYFIISTGLAFKAMPKPWALSTGLTSGMLAGKVVGGFARNINLSLSKIAVKEQLK